MAVYVITGKLGGGKTLCCIDKINEALYKNQRVATNLDLSLINFPSVKRTSKSPDVTRVPDRPTIDNIKQLGYGIKGVNSEQQARKQYDESKFGSLILDECGTWLNSRDWQAEGRKELIDFLLHIRKKLWHVYLIIQDISMLDKQVRKSIAEHVVYCRRMDRINIPVFGFLWQRFTGNRLPLPRLHIAHVKYGDQPNSMTVERWYYRGDNLFSCYDTTQVFSEHYDKGNLWMLTPWHIYRNSFVKIKDRKFYMRLTKIYFRQHAKTTLLAFGVVAGFAASTAHTSSKINTLTDELETSKIESEEQTAEEGSNASGSKTLDILRAMSGKTNADDMDENGDMDIHRLKVSEYSDLYDVKKVKFASNEEAEGYSIFDLQSRGVLVKEIHPCTFALSINQQVNVVTCF